MQKADMNTTTETLLSEKTWETAVILARQTAREGIATSGPVHLTLHEEFLEPIVTREMYRPEQVSTYLLGELERLAGSVLRRELSEGCVLLNICRLTSFLSLLENLTIHLEQKGAMKLLRQPVDDVEAEDVLFALLDRIWMQQRDADRNLIYTPGGVDAFELLPAGPAPFSSFPRTLMCYPNLYLYFVLGRLLNVAKPTHVDHWSSRREKLGQGILHTFLDESGSRLLPGPGLDPDSPFSDLDWSPMLPHSTALFLACNLGEESVQQRCLSDLKQHLDSLESGCLGMATAPPPPGDALLLFRFHGWSHVAGTNHPEMCARSARLLYHAGAQDLAETLLARVAEQAVEDGGFFPWYTPDNCPQGAHPDPKAGRAFLNAVTDIHPLPPRPVPGWKGERKFLKPLRPRRAASRSDTSSRLRRKQEPLHEEKRENRRIRLEMQAELQIGRRPFRENCHAAIRFPSKSGLAVQSHRDIPVGTRVRITLDMRPYGGSKTCRMRGKVVWAQPKVYNLLNQCGVELIDQPRTWSSFIEQKL